MAKSWLESLDKHLILLLEENSVLIITSVIIITVLNFIFFYKRQPKSYLQTTEGFNALSLIIKNHVNHNTLFLRFKLPIENQKLGLPIGQHLVFKFTPKDAEKAVFRPYTPVSTGDAKGVVDFVIKVYPNGLMTQYLEKMNIGDSILIKGPKGKFQYKRNMKKHIGMLAGGTGITPMYQVIQHIINDPKDTTKISLIYANIAIQDILLKKDIDRLHETYPDKLNVYYVIEKTDLTDWKYGIGYITKEMIKTHCPSPSGDCLLLWCGPPPMCDAMQKYANELNYSDDMTFAF